jgi:hypothetical protein
MEPGRRSAARPRLPHRGLEGKKRTPPSGRGRKMSLTSPLIEQAITLFNPEENVFLIVDECNGDVSPVIVTVMDVM